MEYFELNSVWKYEAPFAFGSPDVLIAEIEFPFKLNYCNELSAMSINYSPVTALRNLFNVT
jgi:hypothetical protein